MFPRIPQNSYVLVGEWRIFKRIKHNQAILINHPKYGLIIKTVAVIDKNNLIWCKGENATSMTIEKLGPVSQQQIIGRVIKVFTKPHTDMN